MSKIKIFKLKMKLKLVLLNILGENFAQINSKAKRESQLLAMNKS